MKKRNATFLFIIATILALNSCGQNPSSTTTPAAFTPTTILPVLTSVLPTPTIIPIPKGKTIVVTSAADSGSSTLRQALLDAKPGDNITFDPTIFPPDAPVTIALSSSLPDLIRGNLTIDASNAGVILDGKNIAADDDQDGITVLSNDNTIRGMQIVGFPGAGIALRGGAQHNVIGGARSVGTAPLGQGNLVSGNGNFGIGLWDEGTSHNIIQGNYIGITLNGTEVWGQSRDGIHSNGANYNRITGNVIGGNDSGIYLCCVDDGHNIITANIIGTNASGAIPLGNRTAGVLVDRTSYNVIGPDNVIAYNTGEGIMFWDNTSFNTVTQNSIHDNGGQGIGSQSFSSILNTRLAPPLIFEFDLLAGSVEGWACANCTIEIFSDNSDEGAVYEGRAVAENTGAFIFTKGSAFNGPRLTLTATDADGNTSGFSKATSGTAQSLTLQDNNHLPRTPLNPRRSQELEDNHIGTVFEGYDRYRNSESVYAVGYKWMRLLSLTEWGALNESGVWQENLPVTVNTIPPAVDEKITEYAGNGITIVLNLSAGAGLDINSAFKNEEEVDQYTEYVRMVVRHFKGRIYYYEIWNEPTGKIEVDDYVHLVKHVVPVIKEEDPEARIAIGAFAGHWQTGYPGYGDYYRWNFDLDYMLDVLRSGVVPLVDVISWHPFFGNMPDDPYYQNYPEMVKKIKDVATSEGFTGEYLAEELFWTIVVEENWPGGPPVSPLIATKLFARAIVTHRGLDVTVAINDFFLGDMAYLIHNLNNIFSGAKPISLPVEIESRATNIMSYSFSLPNGDKMFAVWTNGMAVENDPGILSTLIIPGYVGWKATGVDVLNGIEQELVTSNENGDLIIRDFLLKDYPNIIRFSK